MGWNHLQFKRQDPVLKYIAEGDFVYFVHSYYAVSEGSEVVASALYGVDIPAVVRQGNVTGMQFHPEKSGSVGHRLLKAYSEMIDKEDV